MISGDTPFGIPTKPQDSKKKNFHLYDSPSKAHAIQLFYIEKQNRRIAYLENDCISKNEKDIAKIKVFIPEASGSGSDPQVLGRPEYAPAGSVCSQSYLYIPFETKTEATNFISYLKTKFFRILVSASKISQHTSCKVYRFVPMQDFTKKSDIDWNRPVPEIDAQLYKKYGMDQKEISSIKFLIKPME